MIVLGVSSVEEKKDRKMMQKQILLEVKNLVKIIISSNDNNEYFNCYKGF